MTTYLLVPMRLDALHLATERQVTDPLADWSVLPYSDPQAPGGPRDLNSDTPWLGAEVLSEPFFDTGTVLGPGVHLHWALPDALTRGAAPEDPASGPEFPAVPNRWLVARRGGVGAGLADRQWVVESDYLWSEGTRWHRDLVTCPVTGDQRGGHGQPYRYLGRSWDAESWQEDPRREHLARLTAVGWGEPTFHAFYPGCRGVFGHHDPEVPDPVPPGLFYEVFGWYDDETADPLFQRVSEWDQRRLSAAERREEARAELDWTWDEAAASPRRILCYARLAFARRETSAAEIELTPALRAHLPGADDRSDDELREAAARALDDGTLKRSEYFLLTTRVAVGNTGTEALSAFMAEQVVEGDARLADREPDEKEAKKRTIEHQLEALHLTAELAGQRLDLGPKLTEARHGKSFHSVPGGTVWTLRPRPKEPPPDPVTGTAAGRSAEAARAATAAALPEAVADGVEEVNRLQAAYDRGWAEIRSLRRQIFADWTRYVRCRYRAGDARRDLPPTDLARRHVERLIALLDLKLAWVGELGVADVDPPKGKPPVPDRLPADHEVAPLLAHSEGGFRDWLAARRAGHEEPSVATALTTALGKLHALLDALALPEVILEPSPAPRYWQPNDPVVLLAGPAVRPSDRHGEDGELPCLTFADFDPRRPLAGFQQLSTAVTSADPDRTGPGRRETTGDEWHVLLLEWGAQVAPYGGNVSSVPSPTRSYPPDFLERHYSLDETRAEFRGGDFQASTTASTSYFQGRSILRPHGREVLARRIDEYLVAHLRQYLSAADPQQLDDLGRRLLDHAVESAEDRQAHLDYFETHRDAVLAWSDGVYHQSLVGAYVGEPVVTGTDLSGEEQRRQELLPVYEAAAGNGDRRATFFAEHKDDVLAWLKARSAVDGVEEQAPIHNVLAAQERLAGLPLQSQALGGFHEALLMHRQVLQLDPADPLAFADNRSFTEETVRRAVAAEMHTAPESHFDFHPVRNGELALPDLRLVDTFGRTAALAGVDFVCTRQMATDRDSWIGLPARISQPARLSFRWLSAEHGVDEANAHPLTSPVCGFVVPNNLDRSLMVYGADGVALGRVDRRGRWRLPPGRPGPVLPVDIPNPHLAKMVGWLCDRARAVADRLREDGTEEAETRFVNDFLDVLDSALENVDPEGFEQHEARALLMGRPLALVRASVSLELFGLPASDQSWDAWNATLQGRPFETDGFLDLRFPIRVGEHMQLNDGVVGFWIDAADGYQDDRFYAPQSDWTARLDSEENLAVYHDPDRPTNFAQTIAGPPHELAILLDPRGAVHCTSGVLPTKALRLPAEHFAAALARINVTFLTSPVLSPGERIELPLPEEPGWEWSWVGKEEGTRWRELTTTPVVGLEAFLAAFQNGHEVWLELLDKGWITAVDAERAVVEPPDKRGRREIKTPDDDDVTRLLDVSTRVLGAARPEARFGASPYEIREGWLRLSPRHEPPGAS